MKKLFFAFLAALLVAGAHSYGQTFVIPLSATPPPPDTIEFTFAQGEGIGTAEIGVVPGGHSGIYWTLSPDGAFTGDYDPVSGQLYRFTKNGITVELPPNATYAPGAGETTKLRLFGLPSDVINDISFTFTLYATSLSNGYSGGRRVEVIIHRPVDLAVVLDRSGSMTLGLDGTVYNPPAGQSRWDYLKSAVALMADHLNAFTRKKSDLISVNMFAGSSGSLPADTPFNTLSLIDMNAANLSSLSASDGALSAIEPAGQTPLGNGILKGRDILHAPAVKLNKHKKAMIVFSDGEQNMPFEVVKTGLDAWKKTTNNQWLRGVAPDPLINIYTINLGVSGSSPLTMERIGQRNGGTFKNISINTTHKDSLSTVFISTFSSMLEDILKGSSPQVIVLKDITFPFVSPPSIPTRTDTFTINKGASTIVGTMIVSGTLKPRFISIKKDGRELIPFVRLRSDSGYINFSISFPNSILPGVSSGGQWVVQTQLVVNPGKVQAARFMVMADDHSLKPAFSLGNVDVKVGQSVNPSVTLDYKGNTVSNANVSFILLRPGTDINDLIARRVTPQLDTLRIDPVSPSVAKLRYLLHDTSFLNAIKDQATVYTLPYNAATKSYTASISGLSVTGIYQGIFLVSGTDNTYGTIQRYHRQNFYVRFAGISPTASRPIYQYNPAGGFGGVLIFRPTATNGKLIGPGWSQYVTLESSNAKLTHVLDVGDGSYRFTLSASPSSYIKLSIAGELIYEGILSNLKPDGPEGTLPGKRK